jgi:DNA helicase TIP49 (TBP-interacting protein)
VAIRQLFSEKGGQGSMSYADIRNKRRGSSIISQGMTKLEKDEVLNQTLTLTDIDVINARDGRCAVMLFEEYPDRFYFGGKVLTEMCDEYDKVAKKCCDENTSSYNCLRNYYNQSYHSKLQRKYAKDFIGKLMCL